MDRRTYVRTDGWTDSPCVLQEIVPFGAAAQKAEMMDLRPELGFSGKIWAILLEFGPLCLDLGHFA